MIRHSQFRKMRLAQFAPANQIDSVNDFEFMGSIWVGEAIGFTEWLRHGPRNRLLGSLSLDFNSLEPSISKAVLQYLELPLSPSMTVTQVKKILGDPIETEVFASDRKTYNFVCAEPDAYWLSCTVAKRGGLLYLVVMTPQMEGA